MPSRSGLAIFDLDGTLVDSRRDIAEAANAARAALGLVPLPEAEIVGFVGDGINRLIERLLPVSGSQARARCLIAFEAAYAKGCCRHTRAYDGIPAALAGLQQAGWALGVATNKSLAFTEAILEHCGIRARFVAVRGGDRTRKPDPTALTEIIAEAGAGAGGWMVGDHHTDILAGHAAGLQVAWAGWGFGRREGHACELTLDHPDQLVSSLTGQPA
jgi:phosphoglycolate phosphatase